MRYFQRIYNAGLIKSGQLSDDFTNVWDWCNDQPISWDWDYANIGGKAMALVTLEDSSEYLIKFKLNFSAFTEVDSRREYDDFYLGTLEP